MAAHAVAVGHLIESVAGSDGADAGRFEEDVVRGRAGHFWLLRREHRSRSQRVTRSAYASSCLLPRGDAGGKIQACPGKTRP